MPGFTIPERISVSYLEPLHVAHDDSDSYTTSALERDTSYAPLDPQRALHEVLEERTQELLDTISRVRPDVFIIEYFPFSRWPLRSELLPAIERVRADNGSVICSLRDVHRSPHYTAPAYVTRTSGALDRYFDHILVHADRNVTRLEEHFPWIEQTSVPVHYTGFVSEKVDAASAAGRTHESLLPPHAFVLVSAGGGIDGYEMISPTVEAWKRLSRAGMLGERGMVVIAGAVMREGDFARLGRQCEGSAVSLHRSMPSLLRWMSAADLSISRAGYNSCMNVLETRVRSVLVPSVSLGDQEFRASRLASLGLATLVPQREWSHDRIAEAILDGLARPPVEHSISLDGAQRTRSFVSELPLGS